MKGLVCLTDVPRMRWRLLSVVRSERLAAYLRKYAAHILLVLLAVLLLAVYGSVLQWILRKYVLSGGHWHWALALVAVGLACKSGLPRLTPVANNSACMLLIVSVLAHFTNQLTLDLTLVSAVLFILSGQAALGLVIAPQRWRTMMWPVVVGFALLPLDFYLEPFLGYPLRLFSAQMANNVLQEFGVQSMTVQSIVMVDNRASVVDLDCSGINSLWAGGILYLILSWLMGLVAGFRWFMLGVFFICLLLVANTLRIVALVVLDMFAMQGIAQIAHGALGLVGFTVAFLVIWLLAERLPKRAPITEPQKVVPGLKELRIIWPLLPLIGLLLTCLTVLLFNKAKPEVINSSLVVERGIELPVTLQAESIELNYVEREYFGVTGARADKYALIDTNASLVLVTSRWWKAHHIPDYCLQSQGFSIGNKALWKIGSQTDQSTIAVAVRVLQLTDAEENKYTAVYWFQAGGEMVADYSARVTDALRSPDRRWTMASMLIKGELDEQTVRLQVADIHQAIAMSEG